MNNEKSLNIIKPSLQGMTPHHILVNVFFKTMEDPNKTITLLQMGKIKSVLVNEQKLYILRKQLF